jgi:hypothetical protein
MIGLLTNGLLYLNLGRNPLQIFYLKEIYSFTSPQVLLVFQVMTIRPGDSGPDLLFIARNQAELRGRKRSGLGQRRLRLLGCFDVVVYQLAGKIGQ